MHPDDRSLDERLSLIEDLAAIKQVQRAYWWNIDRKQPESLRHVFAEGDILIDFEDMPVWRSRDAFVAFFESLGLDPARQENHFGLAPDIQRTSPDAAEGTWRLLMLAYDYDRKVAIRITGAYACGYVRTAAGWRITRMIFRRHSLYTQAIGPDDALKAVDFGQVAPEAAAYLFGD